MLRLDFVELLESPIDIERVQFVGGDAVRHQCCFECCDRMVAERTTAGEFLDVPEIGPAVGCGAGREFLLAIGQHARIELVGDRIVAAKFRGHRGRVGELGKIELLDQTLLAAAQAIARWRVDDVPGRLAAGDLGFDHRPGVGCAVLIDGNAELLGCGIQDRHRLRLLIGAALRDEGDLVGGLCRDARESKKCQTRRPTASVRKMESRYDCHGLFLSLNDKNDCYFPIASRN